MISLYNTPSHSQFLLISRSSSSKKICWRQKVIHQRGATFWFKDSFCDSRVWWMFVPWAPIWRHSLIWTDIFEFIWVKNYGSTVQHGARLQLRESTMKTIDIECKGPRHEILNFYFSRWWDHNLRRRGDPCTKVGASAKSVWVAFFCAVL